MKAKNDDIRESYMLAGGLTDDGQWLDHEYVTDLLDLVCIQEGGEVSIDDVRFERHLDERRTHLKREVQGRNSRYYDQQEELLYRNQQDRQAESEGKIREYKSKEKEAARMRAAPTIRWNNSSSRKKPAGGRSAEEEDEEARAARKKMREEADRYLELIEQALKGRKSDRAPVQHSLEGGQLMRTFTGTALADDPTSIPEEPTHEQRRPAGPLRDADRYARLQDRARRPVVGAHP